MNKCSHCGKGAQEFLKYEGKSYYLPCQQQLEANGAVPWEKKRNVLIVPKN